jgi:hypothetical protein
MSKLDMTRPAGAVVLVTKSTTVEITPPPGYELPCRALLVGTAGDATIVDGIGVSRSAVPLQAGYNPLQCRRVSTGGTADNIWALF